MSKHDAVSELLRDADPQKGMSFRPRKRARLAGPGAEDETERLAACAGLPPSPIEPTAIDYQTLCFEVTQRPSSLLALVEFVAALPPKGSVLREEDYNGIVRTLCERDLWLPLRSVLLRFPQRITLAAEELARLRAFKCALFIWHLHDGISSVLALYRMLKRARFYKMGLHKDFSFPQDDNDYLFFYSPKDFLWRHLNDAWCIVAEYWLPAKLPDTDLFFLLSK